MRFFEGNMAEIADTNVLDGGLTNQNRIRMFSPPTPNLENGIPTTDTNYEWYRGKEYDK